MNSNINEKLISLCETIENNEKIIRMKELKKVIEDDESLKKDLDMFHEIMSNPYSNQYISLKKKILDNASVKEYKILENELFFVVLDINRKLKDLINKRKCSR